MPLAHEDFFAGLLREGFFSREFEPFAAAVAAANDWIDRTGVEVINVETVVLPNLRTAQDAEQVNLRTSGEMASQWIQFVRVWHIAPPRLDPPVPPALPPDDLTTP